MAVSFEETARSFALAAASERLAMVDNLVPGTFEHSFFSMIQILHSSGPLNRSAFEQHLNLTRASQYQVEGIAPLLTTISHRFYLQMYDRDGLSEAVRQYLVNALQLDRQWQLSPEMQGALSDALHGDGHGSPSSSAGHAAGSSATAASSSGHAGTAAAAGQQRAAVSSVDSNAILAAEMAQVVRGMRQSGLRYGPQKQAEVPIECVIVRVFALPCQHSVSMRTAADAHISVLRVLHLFTSRPSI